MDITAICHVVCWRRPDNSEGGIVGYSFDQTEADAIMRLLQGHAETRTFYLVGVQKLPKW